MAKPLEGVLFFFLQRIWRKKHTKLERREKERERLFKNPTPSKDRQMIEQEPMWERMQEKERNSLLWHRCKQTWSSMLYYVRCIVCWALFFYSSIELPFVQWKSLLIIIPYYSLHGFGCFAWQNNADLHFVCVHRFWCAFRCQCAFSDRLYILCCLFSLSLSLSDEKMTLFASMEIYFYQQQTQRESLMLSLALLTSSAFFSMSKLHLNWHNFSLGSLWTIPSSALLPPSTDRLIHTKKGKKGNMFELKSKYLILGKCLLNWTVLVIGLIAIVLGM